MKRALYDQLISWKNNYNRKPLLLQGARQVGKTYLVNAFGRNEYNNYIYLNFEQDSNLHNLFDGNLEPHIIISNLSLYLGKKIESEDTLLFFDEIQTLPSALTSLKYFYEKWPELHIIAAGSLLGISVGKDSSFPVGKVNFMTLYPLQFTEYLIAFGEELIAEKLLEAKSIDLFPEIIHYKLLSHLKNYLYLGGMPEVLQSYLTEKDITKARTIQNEILKAYQRDFSKYTEKTQAIRTSELWNSVPNQLAKENKKFKYSDIRKNARSKMYEQTIEWLKNAGLIHLAYNIQSPKIPLTSYADYTKFKIFLLDTGLLGAMLNLTPDIIIKPNELFKEYNGAFIENFVASELLLSENNELYYWTSKSDAEVDFILQVKNGVYPLEVKSGTSRNLKSIRSYADKYKPKYIFRTSPRNFNQNNEFINLPLYAVFLFRKFIQTKMQ
ncbi:MAG: AAA family ATPase [Bacteroidales bacterium]|jgi:predicted AAA+ superfamily ATPase|nr:AAA family ATPase [Bacteroidales bacterium]